MQSIRSLILAVLLLCVGCAGLPQDDPTIESAADAPAQGMLPDLKMLEFAAARTSASPGKFTGPGSGAVLRSSNSMLVPENALALNTDSAPAWAIYEFSGLLQSDQLRIVTVGLDTQQVLPMRLFIGVSNFDLGSWHWWPLSTLSDESSLTLPQGPQFFSAAGNAYIAVVAANGPATLRSVSITLATGNLPPVDLRASNGTSQQAIQLSWTDPATTYAGNGGFGYTGIAIDRALQLAGPWHELATVVRGTTEYSDTSAVLLDPGQHCWYRLRTLRDGRRGYAGVPDGGYVDFAPVAHFTVEGDMHAPAHLDFSATHRSQFDWEEYDYVDVGAYDPDGGSLSYAWDFEGIGNWVSTGDKPEAAHDYFRDATARLRVTDEEGSSSEFSVALDIKGSAQVWRPDVTTFTRASDADVDPKGNMVLCFDLGYLMRCDPDGNLLWARQYGVQSFADVSCAADGSFYVLGWTGGQNGQVLAHFTADGELIQSIKADALAIRADEAGSVYLLSRPSGARARIERIGSAPYCQEFLDADGGLLSPDSARGLTLDKEGNLYISCSLQNPDWSHNPLALKINPAGKIVWQKKIETEGYGGAAAFWDVDYAPIQEFISGFSYEGLFAGLYGISTDGTLSWARLFPGATSGSPVACADNYLYFESQYNPLSTGAFGRINLFGDSDYAGPEGAELWGYYDCRLAGVAAGRPRPYTGYDPAPYTAQWRDTYVQLTRVTPALSDTHFALVDVIPDHPAITLSENPRPEPGHSPYGVAICDFEY